jgi:hypothetical protein
MPIDIATQIQTAALTIIGGVLILVLGELAKKFFIEPIHEQAKLLGEIAASMTISGNVGAEDGKEYTDKATLTFRTQSGHLRASTRTIRWYWLWSLLGFIPKRKKALAASSNLIGLANSTIDARSRHQHQKELKANLGFNWE